MTPQDTESPTQERTPDHETAEIRIYVACLAAYNNARLYGRWIDATLGEDHIWNEVRAMLAASPQPGAEEWAIHDHEGFEGAPIHEYSSFETVAALATFIEERGELGGKLLAHFGGELSDAQAAFEDYAGEHKSLADFAEDLNLECGPAIPKRFEYYIGWQAMGRDMEMSGDVFTVETGFEEVHVFWTR